jgi:hypothetical protein
VPSGKVVVVALDGLATGGDDVGHDAGRGSRRRRDVRREEKRLEALVVVTAQIEGPLDPGSGVIVKLGHHGVAGVDPRRPVSQRGEVWLSRDRGHVDLVREAADEEALEARLTRVSASDLGGREVVTAGGVHVMDEGDEFAGAGAHATFEDIVGVEARSLSLGHGPCQFIEAHAARGHMP